MHNDPSSLSRRRLLQLSLAGAAASAVGPRRAQAASPALQKVDAKDRKLLFVLGAWGGASIIDSFMPVAEGEVGDLFLAQALNVFPDAQLEKVEGSAFRVPRVLESYSIFAKPTYTIADFVRAHGRDLAVLGHEVSSVNHAVAQHRSLTGAGVNRGRTLMEAMALRYGGGMVLPSCNMAADGYLQQGADTSLPSEAFHEVISTPLLFATGTHGYRGIVGAPSADVMARARGVRSQLEDASVFGRTFADDPIRSRLLYKRDKLVPQIESADILDKLLLKDPQDVDPRFGLRVDPLAAEVRTLLPGMATDRSEAQVALAFLLAYHGISTSVVMGYSQDSYVTPAGKIVGSPIAFDFSHNNHRVVQSLMWSRTLELMGKLITLLKTHDYMGDPALGKMWDRSLLYVATEFGRDKKRPFLAGSWGTGHDLNNGSIIVSPLVRGNAVYGGVDPRTCLTHGFDPQTGKAVPGKAGSERDVYGVIAHALDLDSPPTERFPGVVR